MQNPQGEPVSGVTISYGYALNEVEAMSDKNGTYTFFGLKPGEKLSLRAIHADLKLRGKIEVEISLDAKAVSFLEKDKNEIQPYINTDIQLEPYETTRIEGRLVDEKGNPIPSGRINIFPFYKPDDRNLPLPSTVFSDETGSYSFDDLIVGDKYRVIVVDAKGYVSNKNSNYEDMFIAEKNMEPHKDLVLSLQGDIWLEGKVVDSEGNPVVGAKLSSWNDNNSAVTDTYGKYRLGNLSNILIYSLTIVQKDFGIYQFKYIPANQIKNFTLAKGKYFIAGTVVDSEGNSVDSVLVNVYPRLHISGKHSPSVYTASDGTFLLENLYDELITINVGTRKGSQIFENVRTGRDDMLLVLDNLTQRNSAYARFFDEFNKIIKDKPAPELEIDQWVNCEPMILDDLLGRIVLVDFFFDRFKNDQTPNRTQLIQVLQEEYGAEGLVCIGICEHTEDFETLKELIREKNLTYPIAVDKESTRLGSSGLTFDAYRINPQAPLSIVIDKNGIVRSQTSHMFLESTIKELIKEGN